MPDFPAQSLAEALESALVAADHLEPKHAATVVAARALAEKIDAWQVIVEWALEDAAESESRPKVPANDNTSLPTFLKYMEALQLVPPAKAAAAPAKPEPAAASDPAGSMDSKIISMQRRAAELKAR